ncbi:MAG: tetratricopeptide repeat protein [Gemmatimonadetes bacterium]|nr:tetratricopeptide repeat protein [Gemmatimonadota bacterium]
MARASSNPRPEEQRSLYEQALNASLESTKNEPENARGWVMLGRAYLGLDNYVGADSALDMAEKIYPKYVLETDDDRERGWIEAYNGAIQLLQQGSRDGAIELFKKAAVIFQGRPEAYLNLGASYANVGDDSAAIEAYRQALEILRKVDRSQIEENTLKQWDEHEQLAAFNMAQLLARVGRHGEAAGAYEDYLKKDPNNVMALTNYAVTLMSMEQRDSAMAIYGQLLASTDLKEQDYFVIGVGLFRVEDYTKAEDAFRKALEVNPYSRDARYNLAQALYQIASDLQEKEDTVNARTAWADLIPVARKVAECDPYNRNALALLAHGLARSKQEQEAVQILERHRDLPFEVGALDFRPEEQGGATLRGSVVNLGLDPGKTVSLKFTFYGTNGQDVGSKEVSVQVSTKNESAPFDVTAESTQMVAGYCYSASS